MTDDEKGLPVTVSASGRMRTVSFHKGIRAAWEFEVGDEIELDAPATIVAIDELGDERILHCKVKGYFTTRPKDSL